MATDANLRGVYIPIITPFAEDGSVAIDALERLCREYLDAGAAGIVALGTTGESTALDADEKRAVIDGMLERVRRAFRTADRRRGHEQHSNDATGGEGARRDTRRSSPR